MTSFFLDRLNGNLFARRSLLRSSCMVSCNITTTTTTLTTTTTTNVSKNNNGNSKIAQFSTEIQSPPTNVQQINAQFDHTSGHAINLHHKLPLDFGDAFYMPKISLIGPGSLNSLLTEIAKMGWKKCLFVTGEDLVQLGALEPVLEILSKANVGHVLYDGVLPNPTVSQVNDGCNMLLENQCDFVISFGGGSPHDCAKFNCIVGI